MDTLLAFTCEARACAAVITTADRRFPPTKPPGLCPEDGPGLLAVHDRKAAVLYRWAGNIAWGSANVGGRD
jgi:hypothetical protein